MTAVRLPMISALLDPAARATAVTSLCAASIAGARIPLPALDYPFCDAARPRLPLTARALPLAGMTATLAVVVFNSP
jgi:hypothetical protein